MKASYKASYSDGDTIPLTQKAIYVKVDLLKVGISISGEHERFIPYSDIKESSLTKTHPGVKAVLIRTTESSFILTLYFFTITRYLVIGDTVNSHKKLLNEIKHRTIRST